jgi:HD-GYP domain-containing protein (c-di-GMP phosphodiesterase class II)
MVTQGIGAVSFLLVAGAIAALAPWHRSLSGEKLALVLVAWFVVDRVKFPVADGFTKPTVLAFVPALFLLPVPVVPLVAALALLAHTVPGLLRHRIRATVLPSVVADCWFTIGPALVLILAGGSSFAWSHWPIYLGALAAQIGFDATSAVVRTWIGDGISPRVQIPLLTWIYLSDISLAPLGLLVVAAAVHRPGLILITLAPLGLLGLFARERRQRIDETIALTTAYRGTAMLLGDIVEADDRYTGLHSRDVVDLAVATARQMGLARERQRHVEFAALLHDVGKIRLPKELINKPGPLAEQEWQLVRRHTIDGEQMLKLVGGALADVGRIVRASHERFDGRGYPDELAGEAIPIEARIVSACDAYSAMTTDRPYRAAMMPDEALAELRRCAGTQFDPAVVDAIERLLVPSQRSWLDLLATTEPIATFAPAPKPKRPSVGPPGHRSHPSSVEPAAITNGSSVSS